MENGDPLQEKRSEDLEQGRSPNSTQNSIPRPAKGQAAPNGGLRAWSVVLGATMSQMCTFGYIQSFGVYQQYYQRNFLSSETPSNISWIGSLQVCLLFLSGLLSGPLFDRYGARAVLIPASITMVFSVMMTSLCRKMYEFILAQGILGGFACGMIFTPVVSAAGQYFTTRRALAMGLVTSGASIGGVIWPIVLNRLLNFSTIGFGWTVRIVGFIMLPLLATTCALVIEWAPRRKGRDILLPAAWKNVPYVFANIGFFTTLLGLYTPIFYLVTYSVAHGMSLNMAFYEVSIYNAGSFLGRTTAGTLADRFGRFNMMILTDLASAILIFCWIAATSNAGITVFAVFFGIMSGAVVSLYSPCVAECATSPSDIGTYLGMGMGFCSLAGLTGTPMNGAMIRNFGTYWQASVFSGLMVIVGTCSNVVSRLWLNKKIFAKA
ncbi:MAG: hypothetical protein M1819_004081 [Sarea resinae]|nr:MAG: hypothetical protein M1819_004081 [Sarea resinae]